MQAFEDGTPRGAGTMRRARTVLAECGAVLGAGVAMRARGLARGAARATAGLSSDAAYSLRVLRRSPGFTAAVCLTLSIGIGANAAVFGLVRRTLLEPPPYTEAASLVLVWHTLGASSARFRVPAPDAAELERRSAVFSELAFLGRTADGAIDASDGRGVEHVRWATATPDLLDVLGVRPLLGSGFAADSTPDQVLLSHGTWRAAFGADPAVVGRTTRLNGRPVRIAAVMGADFRIDLPPQAGMGGPADVWSSLDVPLDAFSRMDGREVDQDSDNTGAVIARLRDGASLETASRAVARVAAELRNEVPAYAAASRDAVVRPMHEDATAHLRGLLTALIVGVGAVLLASCLNVSTLVVARGARRRSELAVRAALGAGGGALVRQLAMEAVLLASLGTLCSIAVASAVAGTIARWAPAELGRGRAAAAADPTTFALAALLAVACTLAFTLVPAIRRPVISSTPIGGSIAQRIRTSGGTRGVLVASQVAVSVVLVFATALLLEEARDLREADLGFDPREALTFSASLRVPERYTGPADRARLVRRIETELAALPSVRAVGLTAHLPLAGRSWTQPYGLPGQAETDWADNRADFRTVTSGYFEAIGARLLQGRSFRSDEDLFEDRRVVVIDDLLAERLADEVGRSLGAAVTFPLDGAIVRAEVVGIVGHIRHEALAADGRETLYVPYRQEASRDVSFVLRTDRDPLAIAPEVRRTLRAIDADIPVHGLRTLTDYVDAAVAPTRFVSAVIGVFALLVLLSVAVGLYGVVALDVVRRTRDIGVRIAVGAGRAVVLRSVLLRGFRLAAAGCTAGIVAAVALERISGATAIDASRAGPYVWPLVLAVVLAVALLASWVPAWRASRLDPTLALKSD